MDDRNIELAESIVNSSYIKLGYNSINRRQNIMKQILSQRQLPQKPLDNLTIKYFLNSLALMDSNNFDKKIGVGQRQARIYSSIVSERHFYMFHGIGRSGDVMANQPKAAGSSLLLQITKFLVLSALKQLHYNFVHDILLLPLATGMSISLSLLTLSELQPNKKYVIWSRIDQKTCLKSILTSNLIPIIIQLHQQDDYLCSNILKIQQKIQQIGIQNILTIISTTSCFAPRITDNIIQIAILAKKYHLYHIINNAYGLWCNKITHQIKQATINGQVTIVVQSSDKNFMVPVGGSIVWARNTKLLQTISGKYPGRANGSPIVDLFITLLSMGKETIHRLKQQRKQNYILMKKQASKWAQKHQLKLLQTPKNTISMAMNLKNLDIDEDKISLLGSILYSKRVMGHRIVTRTDKITKINNLQFKNYGSHSNNYTQLPYITFACAVGTKSQEIYIFFQRLETSLNELIKKIKKNEKVNLKQKKQKKQKEQITIKIQQKEETKQDQNSISKQIQQIDINIKEKEIKF